MYASFFGLQLQPFSIAPDPRYLFMSERHREALAHLLYGLDAGGGFVLLTGEIGTGKTTVCRCFLEQIPAQCNVAYIFNPKLTVQELLRSICDEFGVAHTPAVAGQETAKDCIDPLNAFLLKAHAEGRNNVLIIDEAQNLAPDVLEQLRLLTNLETSERKLLQIILIGQPELRGMVADPSMEQLAQRVIARYHLAALSAEETQQYVAHRLSVAGLRGPLPFAGKALKRIHALTGGVPRRINLLCDRALLGAYAQGSREVSETVVRKAAQEVFGASVEASAEPTSLPSKVWMPVTALAAAAIVATVGWAVYGASTGQFQASGKQGKAEAAKPAAVAASAPTAAAAATSVTAASAPLAPASASASEARKLEPPAPTPNLTPAQFLQAQANNDGAQAWQLLVSAWDKNLNTGGAVDPCILLARDGLQCYRNRRAGLALVRQLDRPALLTLVTAEGKNPVTVLLRGLNDQTAFLEGANGSRLAVGVSELATLWRGEFVTLRRAPQELADDGDFATNAAAGAWLDTQLAKALGATAIGGDGPDSRRARIRQFQQTQGITPDGLAGSMTLMLLNRAAGVNEPRLRTGA